MTALGRVWHRKSLRTRSLAIALLPLIFAGLAAALVWDSSRRTEIAEEYVRAGIVVLSEIHALHASLAEAASGVRGYLLTADPTFLAPYKRAEGQLQRHFQALQLRVRDPIQLQSLTAIKGMTLEKMKDLQALIALLDSHNARAIDTVIGNKQLLDRIRDQIQAMEHREHEVIRERTAAADRARSRELVWSLLAVILSVGSAVIAAWMFSEDLIRRIRFLAGNAQRLEAGLPQTPVPGWNDELGDLGRRMEGAAALLTQRADEAQWARADAERANAAKTEFLSRISHELRTPLNAILGFSSILDEDLRDSSHRHTLQYVRQAGHHLLDLVNDVLDLSRIEAGEYALTIAPTDLQEVVEQALRMTAADRERRGLRCTPEALPTHLRVSADARRLLQVVLNLLSNAIKFNREGGQIGIRAWTTGDGGCLEIADTGLGIAAADHDRVFQPFERLGRHEVEGTGLGLALSKRLIEAMGGRISFESTEGEGSRFRLWLPVAQGTARPAGIPPPDTAGSAVSATPPTPGKRVLLVEDQVSNRVLIETLLKRRPGWALRTASTLAEASAALSAERPDAILLDLHLPDGHGLHWLHSLRREADPPPVIVLSADVLPATQQAALAAGAVAFIGKPVDATELYSTLERWSR